MSVVHVTNKGCPLSMLLPEVMLISIDCAVSRAMMVSKVCIAKDHGEVCSLCRYLRPCGHPRSVLSPVMGKSMILGAIDRKGQEGFFCSDISDCRVTVENERRRGFCDNPHPPQRKGKEV